MSSNKLQIGFFTVLLITVFLFSFLVLKPYLPALFLAAILRIVFDPVYNKLLKFFKGHDTTAAFISTIIIVIFIISPVVLIGTFLFNDAYDLYSRIVMGNIDLNFFEKAVTPIETFFRGYIPDFSIDLLQYLRQGLAFLLSNIGSVFSGIVSFAFNFFITLLALFYFFRDGSRFRERMIFLSPLSDTYDVGILKGLGGAISSLVKGTLLMAVLQGILGAIGFAIFGVPNPVLWGAVTAITALVPNIGTMLVFVPAIIVLLFTGPLFPALGLLVWASLIVGTIDNLLAPILLTRGLNVHPLLILLSVLGGFWFFGPIGFLAGPVLITLLMTLLSIYPTIVSGNSIDK